MKAITFTQHALPIDNPQALIDISLPVPRPGPRDLLVEVRAVSVNPVDTKVRAGTFTKEPKILGWDATGIVREVGSEVTLFQPGDEVFYAGSIARTGSYSEFHLVDERIVGHKPRSLSAADAAALPLTSITAWELLFDRLGVVEGSGEGKCLLITGAAGGVGSMLVQLARQLTRLTVIGTASRQETADWVRQLGAHHVIDHSQPLLAQLQALGVAEIDYVASLTHTEQHFAQLIDVLKPQGRLSVIDDPESLDVMPLKRKSLSLHWELMFTRSLYETPDMINQHHLLNRVSALIDQGVLQTTVGEHFGAINAANMRRAHALVESGKARGKIVLEGF
ncbi:MULTISPECIES: zinc-binding alcohol dehydrogenase family protein [Pseudomonas]|uniref:Zinc-type alcohol dehydrogenase-like protein n=1 Tax=Pseudomonas fluorescens TaxID=294 RepID=A0A5E7KZW5_PSEFL|nr:MULTISPECIES: zinc-binding alcohol dehydrogenase family protein [Pseudomonas]MDO8777279.1 zinc-binding alcohol dehydrogenase family protein [Burkholderiaceae bacterium]QZB00492.1 zinc-binding alcohol dehydrogenase family protein [Pseudomonas mandelii]TWC17194.1 zinc-binding alcohol dehydrogenase family protein [Pseudomonas sp. SJZ083]TWC44987.1 zinc-binding alcohol dehydrogenase family protein [Pseudomonas sp. SJZ077]VVP04948.1 Zinc-type alcohol dehydrogenase-like protein [Pseudomonas fluor